MTRLLTRVETERIRRLLFEPPKKAPKKKQRDVLALSKSVNVAEPCS